MGITRTLQNSKLNNDFLTLVNKAQENVSFWGYRHIKIPGLKGAVPIDTLAAHVIKLVQQQHFEYSQEERNIGSLISRKINQLYDANDIRLKKRNFLVRLFCVLRSLPELFAGNRKYTFRIVYLTKWNWSDKKDTCVSNYGDGFNKIFNYYTKKQYEREFRSSPSRSLRNCGFEGQKEDLWLSPRD